MLKKTFLAQTQTAVCVLPRALLYSAQMIYLTTCTCAFCFVNLFAIYFNRLFFFSGKYTEMMQLSRWAGGGVRHTCMLRWKISCENVDLV
jgi:hypothetical protein